MKRIAVTLATLLLLTAVDVPPQRVSQPTYLDTLEVKVTSLDVVVTDRRGAAVRGLTRDDFDVRDEGKPQALTNFAAYVSGKAAGEAATGESASAPPRKIIFFIDEMSLHPQTRKELLDNVDYFIRTSMRDGDEAMIVTPAGGEKLLLNFSGDREAVEAKLHDYVDKQTFRADAQTESEEFYRRSVTSGIGEYAAVRPYATRVNRRVTSTLRTLLGFIGGMGQTPGRKVVVLVTTSLDSQPGNGAIPPRVSKDFRTVADTLRPEVIPDEAINAAGRHYTFDARPMIRELGAISSANGVTIYTIQPNVGFRISPPGEGADGRTNQGMATAIPYHDQRTLEGTKETLTMLASATGGSYFLGQDKLIDAFQQLTRDVDTYYSLGYRTPPVAGNNGAVRHVVVTVKGHPEYSVRTRRELMDRTPSREMDEETASALLEPPTVDELGVVARTTTPTRGKHGEDYSFDVAVDIPISKLTFIPADGDKYKASFSVHYAAADAADYATGAIREQTVELSAKELESAASQMYTYTTTLVVSPGTARVAVGVVDNASRLSSFKRLTVNAR